MNDAFFYSAGGSVRRWGLDSGDVVDFFKILKEDGDYLVRVGSATIEKQRSLFTKYPNKRRHHLVVNEGACSYTGQFKKQTKDDFDFYDFDGNKEIVCRCDTSEAKQLVLNVVCDPEICVQAEHRSFPAQIQFQLLATSPWQVNFFYFLFEEPDSCLEGVVGSKNIQVASQSVLLVSTSRLEEGVSISFFSEQKSQKKASAKYSIYHFILRSSQEGSYETQAS